MNDATGVREDPVRIEVRAERPYPVLVGRGVRDHLAATVTGLGAGTALLVHPPTLAVAAEDVRAELAAAGLDAHRVELPDAEEGKSLDVAGSCWEVCGRVGLTRSDVVVALGGERSPTWPGSSPRRGCAGSAWSTSPPRCSRWSTRRSAARPASTPPQARTWSARSTSPPAVLVDLATLDTLPAPELWPGMAEIVKAGFIADPRILDLVEADPAAALDPTGERAARAGPPGHPGQGRRRRCRPARVAPARDPQLRAHPRPRDRASRGLPVAARRRGERRAGVRRGAGARRRAPRRRHRRPAPQRARRPRPAGHIRAGRCSTSWSTRCGGTRRRVPASCGSSSSTGSPCPAGLEDPDPALLERAYAAITPAGG